MRKTVAFFIKFILMTVALWLVLGLMFNVSFGNIIITSIILTVVSFIVDLFVLTKVGNVVAAVGDFALAYFGIWFIGAFILREAFSVTTAAFLSAVFILVVELFFHRYLRNNVFDNVDDSDKHYRQRTDKILQAETSEEFDTGIKKDR